MSKIRLFFKEQFLKSGELKLSADKIHYLKRVMRKKDGEKIFVFNGSEEWKASLKINQSSLVLEELIRKNSFVPDIELYFCLLKNKQTNYLIEKISEIGLRKIFPITSEFSENYNLNLGRLNKIVIEAVEQSDGIFVPAIENLNNLENVLSNWDMDREIFICDEDRKGKQIQKYSLKKNDKASIFIGPVGGWSAKDKSLFNKKANKVKLGSNVLKADTAAIVCLSGLRSLMDA